MTHSRAWLMVLTLALLVGCAGTPSPSNRYTLPSESVEATPLVSGATRHTLLLRPVRVAHYLNSDGIILQLDDITLNQAREHLWAEDISRQLERGLRQRLSSRLPDTRVLGDGTPDAEALVLRVDVVRFQGHHDGFAVASGEWQLRNQRGELLALEPFEAVTELDADGYPALVRALGRSWSQVADGMASRIAGLR
ncbi:MULTISPECIES: membrane integrity-associated transporter subunit PqiC [Halomonadaceae]|uniref:PqiC family protein n=1 Tax=Halomonadaceae TaxID=28256 RepID=UPI00159781EB|nr:MULTISPECIES: ABC-type transport auxiliary lipoprotein family protein [Halomonas]QJQ96579.1 hypothetical protein HIO72_15755 [Halomonas sp. PA5]